MGKGRACSDPFSLNSLIDAVKTEYLYQASVTECPPNDPFNDWTIVYESLVKIFTDIIDSISNEYLELFITDELNDYEGNVIYDEWETIVQNIYRDFIDNLDDVFSEVVFEDSDGLSTLIDDWETVVEIVSRDFIDNVSNYLVETEFIDDDGPNTLTDFWETVFETISRDFIDSDVYDISFEDGEGTNILEDTWETILELEAIQDVLNNESFEFMLYDENGMIYYDQDIIIKSDFIDENGYEIFDNSICNWDINLVDK